MADETTAYGAGEDPGEATFEVSADPEGNTQDTGEAGQDTGEAGQETPKGASGETGDDIPAKFKNEDGTVNTAALLKSYRELEKRFSQDAGSTEKGAETGDGGDEAGEGASQEEAQEAVEQAGLDFAALSKSYQENGGLTEEDYASLEKAGIPKNLVDSYVAGQEAIAERTRQEVFSAAGGSEEAFRDLAGWMSQNSPGLASAYNTALDNGDTEAMKAILQSAQAERQRSEGYRPKAQVDASTAPGSGQETYTSWEEATRDMDNPRYANDPAFRRKVEAKLARSSLT